MKSILPPLPSLPDDLLARSDAAHARVDHRLAEVHPDAGLLVRRILWRRVVEALAGVGPIEYERADPQLLIPPRRRFLSSNLSGRLDGAAIALRYIDTRLTMHRRGDIAGVVEPETPMVFNAFAESRDPSERETNAASIRVTPSRFLDVGSLHTPPAPDRCRELLDETMAVVGVRPPVHPIELASWVSVLMFAIHPFVDGNGRTARLLFQALHSEGVPGGFDWGSIEAWSAHRMRYIAATQRAEPAGPPDSVAHVLPGEFAYFAAERSIEGAERILARIDLVERSLARWRERLGDAAPTYAFVAFERNVEPDELSELGENRVHVAIAEELVAAGLLRRDGLGRYGPTDRELVPERVG